MMRKGRPLAIVACLLALVPGIAQACSCPANTDYWWQQATRVALVRIESVGWQTEDFMTRRACAAGPRCAPKQVARFTQVEAFKGSVNAVPTLASGYGHGDCGIPLTAGTYYVVFLRKDDSNVGICNAAGPYIHLNSIEPFLQSLRRVARDPNAKLPDGPRPSPH